MAATVIGDIQSHPGRYTINRDGIEVTDTHIVKGITVVNDLRWDAVTALGVSIGDAHPHITLAYCEDIQAEVVQNSGNAVMVTCVYRKRYPTDQLSLQAYMQTEDTYTDWEGHQLVATYDGADYPVLAQAGKAEMRMNYVTTVVSAGMGLLVGQCANIINTVNSGYFGGIPHAYCAPFTWLCEGVTVSSCNNWINWQVNYSLLYKEETHYPYLYAIDQSTGAPFPDQDSSTANIGAVYREADWTPYFGA